MSIHTEQDANHQAAGEFPSWEAWQAAAGDAKRGSAEAPQVSAPRTGKISRRELVDVTSQLAIMTRSGVDVASALQSLARRSRRAAQQDMLNHIHNEVLGGKSFSRALEPYLDVFGATFVASVTAGEAAGRLPHVLAELAKLQRRELRLRSTVRTLMAYPVLLASVASLVVLALVLFVLPQFAKIFADFETPLPVATKILIGVSLELRSRFWLWGPLAGLLLAGLIGLRFSETGRRWWDRFLLHVVVFREVTRALLIGRVCRLLGLMIDSGVPLLESLRLARSAAGNSLYEDLFASLENNVLNGRGLGDALLESDFVPASAAETLITAERTGSLGPVTQLIGEHFEEEGEAKLRELLAVIEPAITVGMGLIVAFVVLAVMLPMFDIATFANR